MNYVYVLTSYLASSPLRRPMSWVVSVIWGSRLDGSPICGFCSYTPFIFSSASLRSNRERKKRVIVLEMWALIKEALLLCCTADKGGGSVGWGGRSVYKLGRGHTKLLFMTLEVNRWWWAPRPGLPVPIQGAGGGGCGWGWGQGSLSFFQLTVKLCGCGHGLAACCQVDETRRKRL